MTDRTDKVRTLDAALNRLYQDWDEQVSAPRLTYMSIREQLGEQERPSPLSQLSDLIGRLTAKWRFPVTKSQIGSISAVVAIAAIIVLYVMIIGPGANDAEEIVPAAEPTATAAPVVEPTATIAPDTVLPEQLDDPAIGIQLLTDFVAEARADDVDAYLSFCDPDLLTSAGFSDVREYLLFNWRNTPTDGDDFRNIELVSQTFDEMVFAMDVYIRGDFIGRVDDARIVKRNGSWYTTAPDCTNSDSVAMALIRDREPENIDDVGDIRPFPEPLLYDSEPLSREDASVVWVDYLSSSRVVTESEDYGAAMDLCSDGTGSFLYFSSNEHAALRGAEFSWVVKESVAGRWNEPHLVMTSPDFDAYKVSSRSLHKNSNGTVYAVLLPIGGFGENTEIYPGPSIVTQFGNDVVYEFSDTTQTACRR
ncbi:MAG: hypothetical protein O3B95_03905 [Chloroflexi bacterium]|nr:hypothetical protein [Chloroflexota bacterium]